jgi:hypothetical protein
MTLSSIQTPILIIGSFLVLFLVWQPSAAQHRAAGAT